ncbi:MAG: RNA pseudouridine synthase [Treponema sp.]|jgi:23S rRNA pseudouridine1911/1915/1917 synthase|nr:RNA pseudouridine synthase [Treponema sp.]
MTPNRRPPLESRILYRSENYLVVNKAPGEGVEGVRQGMVNLPLSLEELFPQKNGGFPITAVNRLDAPVSGCALFACNREALRAANAQFRSGTVEKRYMAVVEMPDSDTALPGGGEMRELVHWIQEDAGRNKSTAFTEEEPGRKKAILRFRVSGRGERYLFLEIELITGRRHQIRAQLAALGLHIKGDLKYGAKRSEKNGGIRLHAVSLAFQEGNPGSRHDPAALPGTITPDGGVTLVRGGKVRVSAMPPLPDRLWEACMESKHEQNMACALTYTDV